MAFEFIEKLGAPFYAFHDRDVAPEGSSLAESNRNLDAVVKVLKEVAHELGAEGNVFWGGREGYSSLWNTDMKREVEHLAKFMQGPKATFRDSFIGVPDIVAGEIDVFPSQGRKVGQERILDQLTSLAQPFDGPLQVDGVPENDGSDRAVKEPSASSAWPPSPFRAR